jgi:hypothetical protein
MMPAVAKIPVFVAKASILTTLPLGMTAINGYGSYDQGGDAVNTPTCNQEEFSAPVRPSADQNTDANIQAGANA